MIGVFRRVGGRCVADFGPDEVSALRLVASEIVAVVTDGFDRDDPVVRRLFPDGYRDDTGQAEDFRRYTEGDLKTAKIDQAGAILAALPSRGGGSVELDEEAAESWLRALNDVRLALGVRLELADDTDLVGELDDAVMRDPTSIRVRQLTLYQYLLVVQDSLLEALTG